MSTGDMSDDGKLTLKFVYQTVTSNIVERVGPVTQSGFGMPYLLDPLQVTIALQHSAGVVRKPHGYGRPDFPGKAVIIVIPEKE